MRYWKDQACYPFQSHDLWFLTEESGPITIGDVPEEERPATDMPGASWRDGALETAIGHALEVGASLKEISHAASEAAIKLGASSARRGTCGVRPHAWA